MTTRWRRIEAGHYVFEVEQLATWSHNGEPVRVFLEEASVWRNQKSIFDEPWVLQGPRSKQWPDEKLWYAKDHGGRKFFDTLAEAKRCVESVDYGDVS